jgi:hypothetical protein
LQIGAAAPEKLGKHLAEICSHLRECFGEKFLRGRIDPGDDIQ